MLDFDVTVISPAAGCATRTTRKSSSNACISDRRRTDRPIFANPDARDVIGDISEQGAERRPQRVRAVAAVPRAIVRVAAVGDGVSWRNRKRCSRMKRSSRPISSIVERALDSRSSTTGVTTLTRWRCNQLHPLIISTVDVMVRLDFGFEAFVTDTWITLGTAHDTRSTAATCDCACCGGHRARSTIVSADQLALIDATVARAKFGTSRALQHSARRGDRVLPLTDWRIAAALVSFRSAEFTGDPLLEGAPRIGIKTTTVATSGRCWRTPWETEAVVGIDFTPDGFVNGRDPASR